MIGSRQTHCTLIALAMTCAWLPDPHRLGDARIFTTGRLNLWPEWRCLPDDARRLLCRFLLIAAPAIARDDTFYGEAEALLRAGEHVRALTPLERPYDQIRIELVPGRSADERIVIWMDELERESARRPATRARSRQRRPIAHFLAGAHYSFQVPRDHLPTGEPPWPRLEVTPAAPIPLDPPALLELAERLDRVHGHAYLRDTLARQLFPRLRWADDDRTVASSRSLPPGPMQLLVAPTGSGKSVLVRVMALALAQRGIPVALVVPTVADVFETGHELEQDLRALGEERSVAMLFSGRTRFRRLREHLARPPAYDPDGRWALFRFGYHCALAAYNNDPDEFPVEPGEEPCTGLQEDGRGRGRGRPCPFMADCSRHRDERAAATADLLVINHHAFVAGRMQTPFVDAQGAVGAKTMLEVIVARAGVILIDEVDGLQKALLDMQAGALQISSRRYVSMVHQLFRELEEHMAQERDDIPDHMDRARRSMMLIQCLAQELIHIEQRREVRWPEQPRVRLAGTGDGKLIGSLFGDLPGGGNLLDALFRETGNPEEARVPLREALDGWADVSLVRNDKSVERRLQVGRALATWSWPADEPDGRGVEQTVDLLILRAILQALQDGLNRLDSVLPELELLGLPSARPVRDALAGYELTSVSPLGPLGRRIFGFSLEEGHREPGALRVLSLKGDPHRELAQLGESLALGISGHRRAVLGLSATGFFPGSPMCDVQGELLLVRPDQERDVSILSCVVQEGDQAVQISGVSDVEERLANARAIARGLWPGLNERLTVMRQDPAWSGQARALLVTGSYREADVVADTLNQLAGRTPGGVQRVIQVKRGPDETEALLSLDRRLIETFPVTGADILVAPLSVIARGYNILQPGTSTSAIGAIYVLVRPVPPLTNAARILAHVAYASARTSPAERRETTGADGMSEAIDEERRGAERALRWYLSQVGPYSRLPETLRHAVLCDNLVELAQLAGRARRGGTRVQLYLVDGAFEGRGASWRDQVRAAIERWRRDGQLARMTALHGSFLGALAEYGGASL